MLTGGCRKESIGSRFEKSFVHNVVDWMYRSGKSAGVSIRYSKHKPAEKVLPKWGRQYEVKLAGDRSVTIRLPAEAGTCEFTTRRSNELQIQAMPDGVKVLVTDPGAAEGKEYLLYIRAGSCYTETKIRIIA